MIAVILHPMLRCLRPTEAKSQFSVLVIIPVFVIFTKAEVRRASKLVSVPTKLMIAVILHPILRSLRPTEAEIDILGCREWAWPSHTFSPNIKFRLLVFFDSTYRK